MNELNKEFENIKNDILNLIKHKNEITKDTKYNYGGIYLLYVNNFNNEKIIPIYIGKTQDFQVRHKEHLKELFSLNRLNKNYYIDAIINKYYDGNYKSLKFFKYMIDNNCTLKDIRMIILEECENEEKRTFLELEYINKYFSSLFGFNQLNTITLQQDYVTKGTLNGYYLDNIKNDILNLEKFISYGFNKFNFLQAKGLFERYNPDLFKVLKNNNELKNIQKQSKDILTMLDNRNKLINYIEHTLRNECSELCNNLIEDFFKKNNLKSNDKKKLIIECLLFDKDKKEINQYIQRFAINKNEDIFNVILKQKNNEISVIINKLNFTKEQISIYNNELYKNSTILFKDIIPNKEYSSHPLKDTYSPKTFSISNEDNILYLNIEFSNHGRSYQNDDYPCILNVTYTYKNKDMVINKNYFINSSFDYFFENGDEYYINRKLFSIKFDPFNLWKYSERRDYNTITTTMEYYNGINEFTLLNVPKREFKDVINEMDTIINSKTKIIYTSISKGLIRHYKNIDSLVIKKIIKQLK